MNKREFNMDLLRITACFMVVFLHASGQNWRMTDVTTVEWKAFNLYDTAVRSAVPLFLMLSGKLMLNKDNYSVKDLFKKKYGSCFLFISFGL